MEVKGFMRGTLIITDKGPINIENIKVGDMILTHQNRFEKVLEVSKKQISGHYRLQVQGSPATFVHRNQLFYVREKTQKWNNELQISERVFSNPVWKKAKELTKNDFIMMGKINNTVNTLNITEDECWLLGKFLIKNYVSLKDKTITIYMKKDYEDIAKMKLKNLNHIINVNKNILKCTIYDMKFFKLCMSTRLKKDTIIPMNLLFLPDRFQQTFLNSYIEEKGKYTKDDYYILKDKSNKLIYQIGIIVANINNFGGYSLFIDGEQSYRIQYKDNIPKSANFVRIDNKLWQPVRQLNEIKSHRGVAYTLVTESESFVANNLVCK